MAFLAGFLEYRCPLRERRRGERGQCRADEPSWCPFLQFLDPADELGLLRLHRPDLFDQRHKRRLDPAQDRAMHQTPVAKSGWSR